MKWRTDAFSLGSSSRKKQNRQSTGGVGVDIPSTPVSAAATPPPIATSESDSGPALASRTPSWPRLSSSSIKQKGKRHSLPGDMSTPAPTTPGGKGSKSGLFDGLGATRVGTLRRPEIGPICTPTPRAKRQLISELLAPDSDDELDGSGDGGEGGASGGAGGDSARTVRTGSGAIVTASPALRSIISNKSSCGKNFEQEAGKGGAFTSYTPEEKVGVLECAVCCRSLRSVPEWF